MARKPPPARLSRERHQLHFCQWQMSECHQNRTGRVLSQQLVRISGESVPRSLFYAGRRGPSRWWHVFLDLAIRAKHPTNEKTLYFKLVVQNKRKMVVTLKAVCGPDDDGKPCLTIMLPEED
jgi:hypothetical protein